MATVQSSLRPETSSEQWVSPRSRVPVAKADVVTGGAFGLAVANALFNNNVAANLPASLTSEEAAQIRQSSISFLGSLDEVNRAGVTAAYAKGLRSCFILFTAGSGLCFLLSLFIKEVKFRKDPPGLVEKTPAATPTLSVAGEQRSERAIVEEKV